LISLVLFRSIARVKIWFSIEKNSELHEKLSFLVGIPA
jgi:hypothetical protein